MTFKHKSSFESSEVMKELERIALSKKEPSKEVVTKTAANKGFDLIASVNELSHRLRSRGYTADADDLDVKIAMYCTAETHLYKAHEDSNISEFAHQNDDKDVAPAANNYGKVETLQDQQKIIVDLINKTPTGKYAAKESDNNIFDEAYPGEDVEVAPSAGGYGKVEKPRSQQKKIHDIVKKEPTGKLASKNAKIIDDVISILGVKKKASDDVNRYSKGLKSIYDLFKDTNVGFYYNTVSDKIFYHTSSLSAGSGFVASLNKRPNKVTKGNFWGLFKAFNSDADNMARDFELSEGIGSSKLDSIIESGVSKATTNLKNSINRIGTYIDQLIIKSPQDAERALTVLNKNLKPSLWLLHHTTNSKEYNDKINSLIAKIEELLRETASKVFEDEKKSVVHAFHKIPEIYISKGYNDREFLNWFRRASDAIARGRNLHEVLENIKDFDYVTFGKDQSLSDLMNYANKELQEARVYKSANNKTFIIKQADGQTWGPPNRPQPAAVQAPKAQPAAATPAAPRAQTAQPKPAVAPARQVSQTPAKSLVPEDEKIAVTIMQKALHGFGDILFKSNKISREDYYQIIGTGKGDGSARTSAALDNSWGPNTSKALNAAKKYLTNGNSLSTTYPIEKNKRLYAESFADKAIENTKILNEGIQAHGGEAISIPEDMDKDSNKNKGSGATDVLDVINDSNLYGNDLSSFENLSDFLYANGIIRNLDGVTLSLWDRYVKGFGTRAQNKLKEARDAADAAAQELSKKYLKLVMDLNNKLKALRSSVNPNQVINAKDIDNSEDLLSKVKSTETSSAVKGTGLSEGDGSDVYVKSHNYEDGPLVKDSIDYGGALGYWLSVAGQSAKYNGPIKIFTFGHIGQDNITALLSYLVRTSEYSPQAMAKDTAYLSRQGVRGDFNSLSYGDKSKLVRLYSFYKLNKSLENILYDVQIAYQAYENNTNVDGNPYYITNQKNLRHWITNIKRAMMKVQSATNEEQTKR